MRIVSGNYGSRPLKSVPGMNTRPTSDKVKGAIFSALGHFFEAGYCLDLYGGSGALAIEAVSRGMTHAVITEKYRPAIQTIQQNIMITKEPEKFEVLAGHNRQRLIQWQAAHRDIKFDLVLLDPPYAQQQIVSDIEWLVAQQLVHTTTQFVCETDIKTSLPEMIAHYQQVSVKQYGQTAVYFYQGVEDDDN